MNAEDATQQEAPAEQETPPVDERPNRTAFSKRFSQRHSDIDFEDKEARYAAMNDDADRLGEYEKNGQALSKMLDNNKWLGAMVLDATRKGMHPLEWMASQGIDIKAALEDEELSKKVADQINKFQEKVAEQEKHSQQLDENLRKSYEALLKLGLSDDIWKMLHNANNYDSDISSARDEAAMQARNEKIQNKVRSSATEGIPPSLSSSGAGNKPVRKQKRESFFDDIRSN